MPALNCSAVTCIYNDQELCARGEIKIGGRDAVHPDETCCESFTERKEGSMSNSTGKGCGCTNVGIDCEAHDCMSNEECRCVAGAINIEGQEACHADETMCGSFRCKQ